MLCIRLFIQLIEDIIVFKKMDKQGLFFSLWISLLNFMERKYSRKFGEVFTANDWHITFSDWAIVS